VIWEKECYHNPVGHPLGFFIVGASKLVHLGICDRDGSGDSLGRRVVLGAEHK
jgi:hypothetical protein